MIVVDMTKNNRTTGVCIVKFMFQVAHTVLLCHEPVECGAHPGCLAGDFDRSCALRGRARPTILQFDAFWEGLALKPFDLALGKSSSFGLQRKE